MSDVNQPIDEVYFFWLERAIKSFRQYKNKVFRDLNVELTSDQWVILKRTYEEPGISQKDIALSTFKDPASITRIIDILAKKELMERRSHPSDRRNFSIYLTKQGDALVKELLPTAVEMRKKGLEGITPEEHKALKSALQKITENFS